jgi:WD40 repeat protein
VGEDRGDSAASRKPSGSHEENGKRSFMSPGEQRALSVANVLICTFGGAVPIVAVFTKNAKETLVFSGIAVAVVVLGIVGINRSRSILRRRLRVPAYLILLAFIAVLAAGFASHSLWPGVSKTGSSQANPAVSESSSIGTSGGSPPPAISPTPTPSSLAMSLSPPDKDVIASPAAFSLDGDLVAGAGSNQSTDVYAWNARSGAYVGTLPLPSSFSLEALAFTPNDKSLLVLDAAGGVCRWDLSGTRCSTILTDPDWYSGGPWNSAISGDASTVAYQDSDGTGVDVVNVATGTQVAHFTDPDSAQLMGANYGGNNVPGSAVRLDKDGRVLTVGDANGNLYVWDVSTNQLLATLRFSPTAALKDLAPAAILSPDGRTVLIPDAATGLQSTLWNISSKANVTPADALWPQNWDKGTGSVFFTSDGQGIVTYRDDNSGADLWNATTRAHIATVLFTGSYSTMGLEVYAASGQEILTDDGSYHTYLFKIP